MKYSEPLEVLKTYRNAVGDVSALFDEGGSANSRLVLEGMVRALDNAIDIIEGKYNNEEEEE